MTTENRIRALEADVSAIKSELMPQLASIALELQRITSGVQALNAQMDNIAEAQRDLAGRMDRLENSRT
jgi:prefoldin subunit 5